MKELIGNIKNGLIAGLILIIIVLYLSSDKNVGTGWGDDPIAKIAYDLKVEKNWQKLSSLNQYTGTLPVQASIDEYTVDDGVSNGKVLVMIQGKWCYVYPDGSWEVADKN